MTFTATFYFGYGLGLIVASALGSEYFAGAAFLAVAALIGAYKLGRRA